MIDKKVVLVDMDGVLADTESFFRRLWEGKFPKVACPLPAGEIRKTNSLRGGVDGEEDNKKISEIIYSEEFIKNIPPIAGAIEALKEISDRGHDVFIVTTPFLSPDYSKGVAIKYEWIKEHFGNEDWVHRMIPIRDKTYLKGDIMIEDSPNVGGECTPEWEYVVFTQPYNLHITDKRRIDNWKDWRNILTEL